MSFDAYLVEQLKNPEFAAAYWKERYLNLLALNVKTVDRAKELDARIAVLEETLKKVTAENERLRDMIDLEET